MSEKLKPCPFCGGDADVCEALDIKEWAEDEGDRIWSGYYRCYCDSCWTMQCGHPSKAEAIDAWNRRADEKEER